MRTCIYARKSTHKQGQKETIENQIKICKHYAQDNNLEVVEIKQDTGSGTDDLNRPEVKRLVEDAIEGKYQCVIMKGISRLYRDTEKGLGLIKMLDRHKIRVITVEEMFDSGKADNRTGTGKLDLSRITMYLMFSEMESKKLADRIKYTQIEKARSGEWNHANNAPFGYSFNSETKRLQIENSSAYIVKLIFDLYEQGFGMRQIMHYLNGDNEENKNYPAPKTDRWNQYTIGFILKNHAYIGSVVYNKRSKKERTYKMPELYGKTKDDIWVGNDYNKREDWIVKENAHEAIVGVDQFNKVEEIMNTKATRKGVRSNVSLLAGIAKCGECGSSLTFKRGNKDKNGWIKTKDNYYCSNYIHYGKEYCSSHHIGAKDLEEFVIDRLRQFCDKPQLIDDIYRTKKNDLPNQNQKLQKQKQSVEADIRKLTEKMDTLLEKNIKGDISDQQFKLMNDKFSKELATLSEQLVEVELNVRTETTVEDSMKLFKQKIGEIFDIDSKTKEEKRYLLLQLVKEVVVDKELNVKIGYEFSE